MVVHHIEQHHQPACLGRGNQSFEIIRFAVSRIGRKRQHAIVAPVALTRKIGDRHQFQRGDAEVHQIIELGLDGRESTFGGKTADVQFVDDRFFPGPAAPLRIRPFECAWINHHAGTMNVIRVPARSRIGHANAPINPEHIRRARRGALSRRHEPSALGGLHG